MLDVFRGSCWRMAATGCGCGGGTCGGCWRTGGDCWCVGGALVVLREIPDDTIVTGPDGAVLTFISPTVVRGGGWKFRGGY